MVSSSCSQAFSELSLLLCVLLLPHMQGNALNPLCPQLVSGSGLQLVLVPVQVPGFQHSALSAVFQKHTPHLESLEELPLLLAVTAPLLDRPCVVTHSICGLRAVGGLSWSCRLIGG